MTLLVSYFVRKRSLSHFPKVWSSLPHVFNSSTLSNDSPLFPAWVRLRLVSSIFFLNCHFLSHCEFCTVLYVCFNIFTMWKKKLNIRQPQWVNLWFPGIRHWIWTLCLRKMGQNSEIILLGTIVIFLIFIFPYCLPDYFLINIFRNYISFHCAHIYKLVPGAYKGDKIASQCPPKLLLCKSKA